jgi:hypothetical protein
MNRNLRKNKWLRYSFMTEDVKLAPHMPETRQLLTAEALWEMIAHHGQVILKPVVGHRGFGVIQVSPLGNEGFEIHTENKKTTIRGFGETYAHIKGMIGSRRYMVQQRVQLAEIHNRPFDMRVIVQRKKYSDSWRVTGKVAKVAGNGYIVTNITRSKGTLLSVETAIEKSSLIYRSSSPKSKGSLCWRPGDCPQGTPITAFSDWIWDWIRTDTSGSLKPTGPR